MARLNPQNRKVLAYIAKTPNDAVRELIRLRGDCVEIKEHLDSYKDPETTVKLARKHRATLFVSSSGAEHLVFGRIYDGEVLEMIKFRINRASSSREFQSLPPELNMKYYVLVQGVEDKRTENFVLDFFNQRSHEVDLKGVRYAWIISRGETEHAAKSEYVIKYVRVLLDNTLEDVGPYFELSVESQYFSGYELYEKSFGGLPKKKNKNVSKNAFKDEIGKLHIDRQDLRDVKLRKSKGYKGKPKSAFSG